MEPLMAELQAAARQPRYLVAFLTIVYKEISRFMRIWLQTILPPAITMVCALL